MAEKVKMETVAAENTQSEFANKSNYNFHLASDYINEIKTIKGDKGDTGLIGPTGRKGDTGESGKSFTSIDLQKPTDAKTLANVIKTLVNSGAKIGDTILFNDGSMFTITKDPSTYTLKDFETPYLDIDSYLTNCVETTSILDDKLEYITTNGTTAIIPKMYVDNDDSTKNGGLLLMDGYNSSVDSSIVETASKYYLSLIGYQTDRVSYNTNWEDSDSLTLNGLLIGYKDSSGYNEDNSMRIMFKSFSNNVSEGVISFGSSSNDSGLRISNTSKNKTVAFGDGNYFSNVFPDDWESSYTNIINGIVLDNNSDENRLIIGNNSDDTFIISSKSKDVNFNFNNNISTFSFKNNTNGNAITYSIDSNSSATILTTGRSDLNIFGSNPGDINIISSYYESNTAGGIINITAGSGTDDGGDVNITSGPCVLADSSNVSFIDLTYFNEETHSWNITSNNMKTVFGKDTLTVGDEYSLYYNGTIYKNAVVKNYSTTYNISYLEYESGALFMILYGFIPDYESARGLKYIVLVQGIIKGSKNVTTELIDTYNTDAGTSYKALFSNFTDINIDNTTTGNINLKSDVINLKTTGGNESNYIELDKDGVDICGNYVLLKSNEKDSVLVGKVDSNSEYGISIKSGSNITLNSDEMITVSGTNFSSKNIKITATNNIQIGDLSTDEKSNRSVNITSNKDKGITIKTNLYNYTSLDEYITAGSSVSASDISEYKSFAGYNADATNKFKQYDGAYGHEAIKIYAIGQMAFINTSSGRIMDVNDGNETVFELRYKGKPYTKSDVTTYKRLVPISGSSYTDSNGVTRENVVRSYCIIYNEDKSSSKTALCECGIITSDDDKYGYFLIEMPDSEKVGDWYSASINMSFGFEFK